MEKSFQLDQREAALIGQLDQERTQALAMVGALSLDMEQARKNLDNAAERQRIFIRTALSSRNVERYDNARVQNGSLIVTLPDSGFPPAPELKLTEKVNGSPVEVIRAEAKE
jgi:hypothetical protein